MCRRGNKNRRKGREQGRGGETWGLKGSKNVRGEERGERVEGRDRLKTRTQGAGKQESGAAGKHGGDVDMTRPRPLPLNPRWECFMQEFFKGKIGLITNRPFEHCRDMADHNASVCGPGISLSSILLFKISSANTSIKGFEKLQLTNHTCVQHTFTVLCPQMSSAPPKISF